MVTQLWGRLVQFGFRLLYNEMAWTYDGVSWVVSLGQWRRWQLAALPYLPPAGPLLEIAHGPGHMLLALGERGREIHGCDLSAAMGRQAAQRMRRAGRPLRLTRCAVQALPYADGSFAGILATFPTAYILEEATLRQLQRLLQPGGRLVILPEGHLTGGGPVAWLITLLFVLTGQRPAQGGRQSWEDTLHASRFWKALTERGAAAGFTFRVDVVNLPRSACTVISAEKSAEAV
jgi:ubiquinone/menaquinone biosynthesis C-methylase UbiE